MAFFKMPQPQLFWKHALFSYRKMQREVYNLLPVVHFLSALTFVPRCCQECAKTEGEPCGGELGFSGTCEPGLSCQRPGPTPAEGTCAPALPDHPPPTTTSQRTWNALAWTSMWVESELLFTTSRVRVCMCVCVVRASVYVYVSSDTHTRGGQFSSGVAAIPLSLGGY